VVGEGLTYVLQRRDDEAGFWGIPRLRKGRGSASIGGDCPQQRLGHVARGRTGAKTPLKKEREDFSAREKEHPKRNAGLYNEASSGQGDPPQKSSRKGAKTSWKVSSQKEEGFSDAVAVDMGGGSAILDVPEVSKSWQNEKKRGKRKK